MKELAGKVAVVSGAASCIGRALAERLLEEEMEVVIGDLEQSELEQTAHDLGVLAIQTDVTTPETVQALAQAALDQYGTVHVVYGGIQIIDTFVPILRSSGEEHIVTTTSLAAVSTPCRLPHRSATETAVMTATEGLAAKLARADDASIGTTVVCLGSRATNVATIADMIVEAIREDRLWVIPDAELLAPIAERHRASASAAARMIGLA
jgi:NAD(P)-dependent dehydrogenase (short-subunit alcohol dehydrogenase family)